MHNSFVPKIDFMLETPNPIQLFYCIVIFVTQSTAFYKLYYIVYKSLKDLILSWKEQFGEYVAREYRMRSVLVGRKVIY
jgi:hypothetical protein